MAYGVYYVARGLALNLTEPDLGQPELPDLWDEIYPSRKLPPNQLQCLQCLEERGPDCPEFMYLRVRDGHRHAVHHNTNIRDHLTGESDAHKALKERTAATADAAGFRVEVEDRAADGQRVTDVLIYGANGSQLGVEAQVSYIAAGRVGTRIATATGHGITPLWVVNSEAAHPIDRAPWCRVPNADWRTYRADAKLMAQSGFRNLAWERCEVLVPLGFPCPTTGRRKACKNWHSSWEPSQVRYDDLIAKAAAEEYVPVQMTGRKVRWFWVPAEHRAEFEAGQTADAQSGVTVGATAPIPQPIDPKCTYGQDSGIRARPAPPRDDGAMVITAATRVHVPTLDWRPARHWGGGKTLPCRYCGKPALLRDESGEPAHKVCAEAALDAAGKSYAT